MQDMGISMQRNAWNSLLITCSDTSPALNTWTDHQVLSWNTLREMGCDGNLAQYGIRGDGCPTNLIRFPVFDSPRQ